MTPVEIRIHLSHQTAAKIVRVLLMAVLLWGAFYLGSLKFVRAHEKKQKKDRIGLEVCPKLSDRCDSPQKRFEPYELPFRLPKQLTANALYRSVPFYAVVLLRQRDPGCDGGEYSVSVEKIRQRAQKLFSDRKVFADHQCPDMGAVAYTMEDKKTQKGGHDTPPFVETFVAVYAGKTERDARTVLKKARARFPGATLRRMRVSYSRIVQ